MSVQQEDKEIYIEKLPEEEDNSPWNLDDFEDDEWFQYQVEHTN